MDVVDRLASTEEIKQIACRYARGVDRLDAVCMRSAYHPDATDEHGPYGGNAHEFCGTIISRSASASVATMHAILNHIIEFDDADHARGEVYNISYRVRPPEGDQEYLDIAWGRYLDRYERREGRWAIAHRIWVHEFSHRTPLQRSGSWDAFHQGSHDRGTRSSGRVGPAAFERP